VQSLHDPALVEVRRSRKRVRTVSAWREGERTVIAIPARFTRAQEKEWVHRMVTRLATQERRRRPSDVELADRARELSARYLSSRAVPTSVRWSTKQGRRWGPCTPSEGTIRISDRVRGMPRWVIDYVLLHELTHLLHAGHGPEFWAELDAYPRTQRAQGFLEGYSFRAERGEDAVGSEDDEAEGATGDAVDSVDGDVLADVGAVDEPITLFDEVTPPAPQRPRRKARDEAPTA